MSQENRHTRSFPSITIDQLNEYAEASGDFNKIHLDDEAAQEIGFPSRVVHGMLMKSLFLAEIKKTLPSDLTLSLKQFKTRFRAPAFPNQDYQLQYESTRKEDSLIIKGTLLNQEQEIILDGEVRWNVLAISHK